MYVEYVENSIKTRPKKNNKLGYDINLSEYHHPPGNDNDEEKFWIKVKQYCAINI